MVMTEVQSVNGRHRLHQEFMGLHGSFRVQEFMGIRWYSVFMGLHRLHHVSSTPWISEKHRVCRVFQALPKRSFRREYIVLPCSSHLVAVDILDMVWISSVREHGKHVIAHL